MMLRNNNVYLVVIAGVLVCNVSGYDKSFAPKQNGKRQEGCLHKSLDKIPTSLICSQLCVLESWKCQSYNYFPESLLCELNWCVYSSLFSHQPLSDNSESTYIEVTGSQAEGCTQSYGPERTTCHPLGTASCTEGAIRVSRTCNCELFASGDDCSQMNSLCNNDNQCMELKSAANYAAAKTSCANLNGFVYTVDSHAEQNHLRMFLERQETPPDVWLGFEYYANIEDFVISSNMQPLLGYTNWTSEAAAADRQPCVKMSVSDDYTWSDVNCGTSLQYVCEVPSCPSGFSKFNGTCYHFDSGARYWARQIDYCRVKHADARVINAGYKEENDYVLQTYNSWGTGYPVVTGMSDYTQVRRLAWSHNDWILLDWNTPYKHLGCYVDTSTNSSMDSYTSWTLLTDAYSTRTDPIEKCYYGTKLENYKVWAIQDGGNCRTRRTAAADYDWHGTGTGCVGGEGGSYLNDVYESYNANLFYKFAFHSSAWMNDQRTYFWWHGDSWWWHDAGPTTNGRAVCKIESCPQGFHPHGSKCFKVVNQYVVRDLARDECQSYTNGDLVNPEYPDEQVFLQRLVRESGITFRNFWTGVYDENEDGNQLYQVSQKNVYNNYGVYPIGAEPIWRDSLDSATDVTNLEMRFPMPADGKIVGWEYFSARVGTTLQFSVMRATGTLTAGNCPLMVVGVSSHTSGTADRFHRIDLETNDQINVMKGDYIAMTFRGGSNIRHTSGYEGGANLCGSSSVHPSGQVGQSLNLNTNYGRIYGFRGMFIPTSPTNDWSPFLEGSIYTFNGGKCFYADVKPGFKLKDGNCDSQFPFVCEIKKKHRASPEEVPTDI